MQGASSEEEEERVEAELERDEGELARLRVQFAAARAEFFWKPMCEHGKTAKRIFRNQVPNI